MKVPEGYRLVKKGEMFQKGDLKGFVQSPSARGSTRLEYWDRPVMIVGEICNNLIAIRKVTKD